MLKLAGSVMPFCFMIVILVTRDKWVSVKGARLRFRIVSLFYVILDLPFWYATVNL